MFSHWPPPPKKEPVGWFWVPPAGRNPPKDLPLGQPLIAAAEGRITLRLKIDLRSSLQLTNWPYNWLVVEPHLWKIWKSIGMIIIPNIWEYKTHVPNHQPDKYQLSLGILTPFKSWKILRWDYMCPVLDDSRPSRWPQVLSEILEQDETIHAILDARQNRLCL